MSSRHFDVRRRLALPTLPLHEAKMNSLRLSVCDDWATANGSPQPQPFRSFLVFTIDIDFSIDRVSTGRLQNPCTVHCPWKHMI